MSQEDLRGNPAIAIPEVRMAEIPVASVRSRIQGSGFLRGPVKNLADDAWTFAYQMP